MLSTFRLRYHYHKYPSCLLYLFPDYYSRYFDPVSLNKLFFLLDNPHAFFISSFHCCDSLLVSHKYM